MSKAITERRDEPQPLRWQAPTELAPSFVQDVAPLVSRWVGAFGLALLVLGGVSLLVYASGRANIIGPFLGSFFALLGLGGLLLHAANDSELQIRRAYMVFGLLWLATGAVVSLVPYKLAGAEAATTGALFLPYGVICLALGLLFTTAFVRNETEARQRDIAVYVIGASGAVLALTGFIGGAVDTKFLVPYGVVLIPLGFFFLWAFISMRGIVDDLGYWAAVGAIVLGLAFFLLALGRATLPPLLEKVHWLTPGTPPYLMPWGVLLMAGGLLYAALGATFVSDRQLIVLTRRELGALFFSPLAYLVLLAYTVLGGALFAYFVFNQLWDLGGGSDVSQPVPQVPEPIVQHYIIALFPVIAVLMLVPVLTMRLFSEEKRTGTLEMMFTAPVDEAVVVVSKFLGALIYFMLVWAPWGLYLVGLRVYGGEAFDYRPLVGFAVALLVSGAAFLSMGLFFSSVTRNQLTAAVFTFSGMIVALLLYVIQFFLPARTETTGASLNLLRTVLAHISFVDLWETAIKGKMAPRDLLIFLSIAVFWLFLTVKVLESRKWR
jgi:ABC-type transport system involved in multi-copper enzyme maturation permease subunit